MKKTARSFTIIATAILFFTSSDATYAAICDTDGTQVVLDKSPSIEELAKLGLVPVGSKAGDVGKIRFEHKDGKALQVTNTGTNCMVSLQATIDGALTKKSNATDKTVSKFQKQIVALDAIASPADVNAIVDAGESDLGIPASPAAAIMGLDPSKATKPASPKELAAALVHGRGTDG